VNHPHHSGKTETRLFRHPVVRTGLTTGVLLSLVMMVALVAANRVPSLETYALERNAICFGLFALVALIPIVRFLRSPGQQFTSGIIGWIVLTLAYVAAGNFFHKLHSTLRTPGVVLAYGAALYGFAAVACWVAIMVRLATQQAPARSRRRIRHVVHHPQ
jgi:hypothetical protein